MIQNNFKELVTKYHTAVFTLKLIPNYQAFLRVIRGFLRVNLLKRNQLRLVEIFVTLACNAQCGFCSNKFFSKKEGKLSTEEYLNLIDQCADLDVSVICLIGGEPLLYPQINKLIQRIHDRGMISLLQTNGYLLTEEKVKELAKSGLAGVMVSLVSPHEEEHDSTVKLKGAYQRIFAAKKYCKKYGITFSLAGVVSHQDFINGNFERLVNLAKERKIHLKINPFIPAKEEDANENILLNYDDVKKLHHQAKSSSYVSMHLSNNLFGFGCPAGNSYLGITVTGDILPCYFIPLSIGKIQNTALKEAWEKACQNRLFAKRHRMCFAGVSREFIHNYAKPIFKFQEKPIIIEEHPLYNKEKKQLPDLEILDLKEAIKFQPIIDSDSKSR